MHLLSKSTYMRGKQCPKNLWLYKHRPELRPVVPEAQQAIFDNGTAVCQLSLELPLPQLQFRGAVLRGA